jgi:hypothetical protein
MQQLFCQTKISQLLMPDPDTPPNDLRNRNRLPTQTDGTARSEFERAV